LIAYNPIFFTKQPYMECLHVIDLTFHGENPSAFCVLVGGYRICLFFCMCLYCCHCFFLFLSFFRVRRGGGSSWKVLLSYKNCHIIFHN